MLIDQQLLYSGIYTKWVCRVYSGIYTKWVCQCVLWDMLKVGVSVFECCANLFLHPSQDAKGFATHLLDFIGSNAQYLYSLMAMTASDVDTSKQGQHALRLKHVEMSLQALFNVIHNNAGVEIQCLGHFKLLFSLLRVQGASKLQMLALQVCTWWIEISFCSISSGNHTPSSAICRANSLSESYFSPCGCFGEL